jgi:hypothetical protein
MPVATLKYVRIIIGYNQIWDVEKVEPGEKSSYWWSKEDLKKMRNDYREEVLMEGVRDLIRTRLRQDEDDPAVIEVQLEKIMSQPPNLIAAFLESAPSPRMKGVATQKKGSFGPQSTLPDGDDTDDDESVSSSSSSSSSDSNSSSSSSSDGGDDEDDAILRRQRRKKEEDAVSDSDIYAMFGVEVEERNSNHPSNESMEEGTKTEPKDPVRKNSTKTEPNRTQRPGASKRSTNKASQARNTKQKPSSLGNEDVESSSDGDDDDASPSPSDPDDSTSASLEAPSTKPEPAEILGAPLTIRRADHVNVPNRHQRHHHHHHHDKSKVPAPVSPKSPSAPSVTKGAANVRLTPRRKKDKILTAEDRKALGDRFRQAVLMVVAMERLDAMVKRTKEPAVFRRQSSLIDMYLPSDEERDEVNHRSMARKKKRKNGVGGADDEGSLDRSTHTADDENTECPICLGLVQPTQHRKITLLRRMLCRKCFSAHYTNRKESPMVSSTPRLKQTERKSNGRLGFYRKNHNRSLSPKREAMNLSLSPRREAKKSVTKLSNINRTKSLSPTRTHQPSGIALNSGESKQSNLMTRKGRRAMGKSPTQTDANQKPAEEGKTTTFGSESEVARRRVKSMSPGRLRASGGDDINSNSTSVRHSSTEEVQKTKLGSELDVVLRRVKSISPGRLRGSGEDSVDSKPTSVRKSATETAQKTKLGSDSEVALRRVKSISPRRLRGSSNEKVESKPASIRKRGSSADPSRSRVENRVLGHEAATSRSRQPTRRGVRPRPVKMITQKDARTDDEHPSTLRTATDKESTLDKKKRLKERLAKRRALQRSQPCKTEAATESSRPAGGLGNFLGEHGLASVSQDDDQNTIQSAPL